MLALSAAPVGCAIPYATPPGDDVTLSVDGTRDVSVIDPPDVTSIDVIDVVDVRDAGDASDAADVRDASDLIDAADVRDASDVIDAADVRDASDVIDVADVRDAGDVFDASDAVDVSDVADAATDALDPGTLAAPRPIAPLSTSAVTGRGVTLRWELPAGVDGAQVSICADAACVSSVTTQVTGSSYTVPSDLLPGVRWWRLRARSGAVIGTATSPTWNFRVLEGTPANNRPWGTWPDLNGDGYSDVLLGRSDAPAYVLGGASVLASGATLRALPISSSGDRDYGVFVANAGDVDGDGDTDVLVHAALGRVYLIRPRLSGTSILFSTPQLLTPISNGAVSSAAGDLNGDGYGDVVVASQNNETLYVHYGSATGPSGVASVTYRMAGATGFGSSISGAGDFNADGFSDVLVGDASNRTLYAFFGSSTGLNLDAGDRLPPFTRRYVMSTMVSSLAVAGDVDGDGICDAVVGGNGTAYDVYLGRAGSTTLVAAPSAFTPRLSHAPTSVGTAGDLDGNGTADLFATNGSGQLTFITTSSSGATLLPTENRSTIIAVAACAGDLNRDGFGDIVVGNGAYGHVAFYYGGVSDPPFAFFDGPTVRASNLGVSVASRCPRTRPPLAK